MISKRAAFWAGVAYLVSGIPILGLASLLIWVVARSGGHG